MKCENLKEFEKFLKICRKHGVTEVVHEGITVKFGDMPNESLNPSDENEERESEASLTNDELIFYATEGQA